MPSTSTPTPSPPSGRSRNRFVGSFVQAVRSTVILSFGVVVAAVTLAATILALKAIWWTYQLVSKTFK